MNSTPPLAARGCGRGAPVLLWVLAWLALIGLGVGWALHHHLVGLGEVPLHVFVNGREVFSGVDFGALGLGQVVVAVFAALLLLMLVVGVMSLGLLLGLGLPLLIVAAVLLALALPALVLLLPPWLLLRWLWRRS